MGVHVAEADRIARTRHQLGFRDLLELEPGPGRIADALLLVGAEVLEQAVGCEHGQAGVLE